ncbi:uncharacterized protein LOC130443460 [Diorhabda sublineata]|uniref:uncharacterized protein LOC130443460 n=1 Tax=Diorhabda sublineata TaxID=1163346 RepID=UPI0024E0F5D5|nr:uncharacterized protein LOC130443460 [Diorhabda sublineata]
MDLTEKQQNLIRKIANENDIENFQLTKTPGSLRGDNFLGILTAITLYNKQKTLNLILKTAHQNEAFRKAAPVHEMFDREIYMYNKVFPEFEKYQKNHNIADAFDSTPKLYGYCLEDKNESLVMENLKKSGYKLWDKRIPMNHDHVEAVLVQYANFHAVSLAMRQLDGELFARVTRPIKKNVFDNMEMIGNKDKFQGYVNAVMSNGYKAVEGDRDLVECLKKVESQIYDLFQNRFDNDEFKLVVSHGDCWCNNFLFKYEVSDVPSSLRIIDWQLSSVTTPAYDIVYFLLTNSSEAVLKNYKKYLQLYYEALSSRLREFGCDVNQIFSYDDMEKHLHTFMAFGVYTSIMILKLVNSEPEEAPDFSNVENDGNFMDKMEYEMKNSAGYADRLKTILKFVNENDLI